MGSEQSGIEHFFLALKKELEMSQGQMFIDGRVMMFDKKKAHLILDLSFRDNIILDDQLNSDRYVEICDVLNLSFD